MKSVKYEFGVLLSGGRVVPTKTLGHARRIIASKPLGRLVRRVLIPSEGFVGDFQVIDPNDEYCKVCGGDVRVQIQKGTGLCGDDCRKINTGETISGRQ